MQTLDAAAAIARCFHRYASRLRLQPSPILSGPSSEESTMRWDVDLIFMPVFVLLAFLLGRSFALWEATISVEEAEMRNRGKHMEHLQSIYLRRMALKGLAYGWAGWHAAWSARTPQRSLLRQACARLARPMVAAAYRAWSKDWAHEVMRATVEAKMKRERVVVRQEVRAEGMRMAVVAEAQARCLTEEKMVIEREKHMEHLQSIYLRRMALKDLAYGWAGWHAAWSAQTRQRSLLRQACARLARPIVAAAYRAWSKDWAHEVMRATVEGRAAETKALVRGMEEALEEARAALGEAREAASCALARAEAAEATVAEQAEGGLRRPTEPTARSSRSPASNTGPSAPMVGAGRTAAAATVFPRQASPPRASVPGQPQERADEVLGAWEEMGPGRSSTRASRYEERLRLAFAAADTDGSGQLSKRELYRSLASIGLHFTASEQLQIWRSQDLTRDGAVSFGEYRNLCAVLLERQAHGLPVPLSHGHGHGSGALARRVSPEPLSSPKQHHSPGSPVAAYPLADQQSLSPGRSNPHIPTPIADQQSLSPSRSNPHFTTFKGSSPVGPSSPAPRSTPPSTSSGAHHVSPNADAVRIVVSALHVSKMKWAETKAREMKFD